MPRRVFISQSRPDCLSIELGRDWRRAAIASASMAVVVVLMLVPESGTPAALFGLVVGAMALTATGVVLGRALRRQEHALVRAQGRLLLDGDPLELARVELRVSVMPMMKVPTGYFLSLWVMTLVGPDEVPLGFYPTLVQASRVSGLFEEFVQRASLRAHRHASES